MKLVYKNLIGKILFTIGAIVAIAAAAKVPNGSQFSDTIPIFGIGLFISIIGNLLWHRTQKQIVLEELETHKSDLMANPIELLKELSHGVQKLKQDMENMNTHQVMSAIDRLSADYVNPMIEKRSIFFDLLGQEKAAEILLEVAYGERMLNRTWSAASDDHLNEALHSIDQSCKSYQQAAAKL